jgi:hypothetical protein
LEQWNHEPLASLDGLIANASGSDGYTVVYINKWPGHAQAVLAAVRKLKFRPSVADFIE